MNSDLLTQLGVGGIFALMIIEKVLTHWKQRNGNHRDPIQRLLMLMKEDPPRKHTELLANIERRLNDIHRSQQQGCPMMRGRAEPLVVRHEPDTVM